MIDDITYFLPFYNEINDPNFNLSIYKKKEFYDEKISTYEERPKEAGTLLKAQKIISRFLSSYTPYSELLLKWELGSGKTCAAIGMIEKIHNENSIYDGALIFARGDTIIENIKNEIIFKCTPGQYIPHNYKNLTPGEQVARKNKSLKEYYRFFTFETFASKEISKVGDEYIIETYSNKIIVIDEVHNIRLQDIKNKSKGRNDFMLYDSFHRFLHLVKNCKILLMSGTPIKDSIEEISSVMNLILPLDQQLPSEKYFLNQYFNKDEDIFNVKPEKLNELKQRFKGRISYLEAQQSTIKKQYMGDTIGTLKHFKVYTDLMSEFQTENYITAYEKDTKKKKNKEDEDDEDVDEGVEIEIEYDSEDKDIEIDLENDGAITFQKDEIGRFFTNSRQASLFVFPDGTYGKKGFLNEKYINQRSNKKILKNQTSNTYRLGTDLRKALNGKDNEEKLMKLSKYSSKFSSAIRNILNAYENGKSSFVYCQYVEGSGAILFSLILELFGFSKYSGKTELDIPINQSMRYSVITNKTTSSNETKNIIGRFNTPENMNGKLINVIIGSKVISEGVSLFNIQEEHILTPHWNYSETMQAIGRGYRFGSHEDLINAGITPEFKIYQYVSIAKDPKIISIDLKLYEISEVKDRNIKGIEQIMKESAFDCALNYARNHVQGYDYKRECNYTLCNYKCDDIPMNTDPWRPEEIKNLDLSSYQVYYNHDNVKIIINKLKIIFKIYFKLQLNDIFNMLKDYLKFDVITSLRTIIADNIILYNKFGIQSFLREENNVFFLVDSLTNQNNYFSNYYNKNPVLTVDIEYSEILNELYYKQLPEKIDQLFTFTDDNQLFKLLGQLDYDIKEFILESSIIAQEKNIFKNNIQRDKILDYFDFAIKNINDVIVSSLLFREKNLLKCYKEGIWDECDDEYVELYKESKQREKQILKQNEYFGIYNDDKFCIVKSNNKDDKRQENSGRVCLFWKKPVIVYIMVIALDIPLNITNQAKWNKVKTAINKGREFLIDSVLKNKYIKICNYSEDSKKWDMEDYTREEVETFSDETLQKLLYYASLTVENLCPILREWFEQNNLLTFDENCGTANKKKL